MAEIATQKIFDEDAYQTEFEATVKTCSKSKKNYEVVLDRTCFFPEEGGQTSDIGTLTLQQDDTLIAHVVDVQITKENVIVHMCDMEIAEGTIIHGKIDWHKRFSDMQQHSGEHIMSGLIYKTYGFHNVGFHLSKREVTMDFDGVLTWNQVKEIEKKANQAVYENFVVQVEFPDAEALSKMEYRSKKELDGQIRIVTFPGYDICACCAPHVHRTGEIGLIKVVHLMKYKGGVRLNLLCGARAFENAQENLDSVLQISSLLSAKPENVYQTTEKLLEENNRLKGLIAQQEKAKIAQIATGVKAGNEALCLFEQELSSPAQRDLVNMLTEKRDGYCGVFVGSDDGGYRYIISTSQGDARKLNNVLKEECAAKGGGSAQMTQGSLIGTKAQILDIFRNVSV